MEADGTTIIYFGDLKGGTETTVYFRMKKARLCKLLDGDEVLPAGTVMLLSDFISLRHLQALNGAGPRAAAKPKAYAYAPAVIQGLLDRLPQ